MHTRIRLLTRTFLRTDQSPGRQVADLCAARALALGVLCTLSVRAVGLLLGPGAADVFSSALVWAGSCLPMLGMLYRSWSRRRSAGRSGEAPGSAV